MKRIARTSEIDTALRTAFGADADLNPLVVYEMIAANVNPIRKSAGLYKKARFSEGTLHEMAGLINTESRQIILNHNSNQMPVGRAFSARMQGENLHALFAINAGNNANIISDLDAGVIDQVSVSVLPKALHCSECGFDYFGDEANYTHLWAGECANGHVIGEDGVHVRLVGVEAFTEISLVGMGAVPGARVVSGNQSAFTQSQLGQRLAASGAPADALFLHASLEKPKETSSMDKELVAQLTAALTAQATATAQLATAQATIEQHAAELTARATRIQELEAEIAKAPKSEEFAAASAAVEDLLRRSLIASGVQQPELPEGLGARIELLTTVQAKLSAVIPPGPRSKSADASAKSAPISNKAFRAN